MHSFQLSPPCSHACCCCSQAGVCVPCPASQAGLASNASCPQSSSASTSATGAGSAWAGTASAMRVSGRWRRAERHGCAQGPAVQAQGLQSGQHRWFALVPGMERQRDIPLWPSVQAGTALTVPIEAWPQTTASQASRAPFPSPFARRYRCCFPGALRRSGSQLQCEAVAFCAISTSYVAIWRDTHPHLTRLPPCRSFWQGGRRSSPGLPSMCTPLQRGSSGVARRACGPLCLCERQEHGSCPWPGTPWTATPAPG